MQIGLVGKPSAGKSTFFKAATLADVAIANYPFTTIKPNTGMGYVKVECVDKDKLREFASQNYEAIKESLGIENDFCIHFEDREGNLIDISPITSRRGVGLGSPALEFTLIDTAGAAVGVVTC